MKSNPLNPIVVRLLAIGATAWFGLNVSAQTLIHRYSFNDTPGSSTFADSVATADGSLDNSTAVNANSASLDGSQLQLDGTGGYGLLPGGLISSNTQVSIEFWATFSSANAVWTRAFAFGDQNGSGGADTSLDYCHYAGGNWQNLNIQTAAGSGYANNPGGLNGQTNVHVTVVVDPVNNTMYYYNGNTLMSTFHGTVPPLSGLIDTYGLIGRSLFDIDPVLAGSFDEFRIYSGVVSQSTIALNDASGPNSILSSPGTVQSLNLSSSSSTLTVNGSMPLTFFGTFNNVSNLNLLAYGGATFTSGNTGVLTVNPTNGVVHAVGTGTTTVTGTFASASTNITITVVSLPAALTHRYSFTSDASDSVGGANGTLMGAAAVSGGQLVLDGSAGCYLNLPGDQINLATNSAVTVDVWVTFGNATTWAELYAFGNTDGNGNGQNNIACVPCAEGGGFHNWGMTENLANGQTISLAHGWNNLTAHITSVVDPTTGTMSVYRDGVLQLARYDATALLSTVATNLAYIGRSMFNADPYLPASIDEFRIYSGALTPAQVALTQQEGPSATSLDVGALSSITVVATNYPANAALVAPVVLANYANLSGFNMLPTVTAGANTAYTSGTQPLIITSSDTNIVSVNAQNMLTTYSPGKATLTATFAGKTNSAIVVVRNNAVLTHRYSFTTDASDSVGGANGTLQGAASVSGGELLLTGNNADYLSLPPGLLTNYSAVTVDAWVNFGAVQSWARLWQFYDQNSGGTQNEFDFAPGWGGGPAGNFYNAGFPWGNSTYTAGPLLSGQVYHITCEYGDGQIMVYTNAVLMGSAVGGVAPASGAGLQAVIGHSPYNDPGINGSVDEFRIYSGRLSTQEIQASDLLGPNATLSTTATLAASSSGGNIQLTWPLASAGFSVQTSTNLSNPNWTTLPNVPVVVGGNAWQISVPVNSGSQFFRIWR